MRSQFIAALTAVTLAGCAFRQPPQVPSVAPLPSDPNVLAARVNDQLSARRARVWALRSRAQMTYRSGDEVQHAKQVIVAERPDRLRFEVYSLLGSLFVLTVRDGILTAYLPREATVYRGAASPANLAHYTRVDLPVSTAIDLLLGTPPLSPHGATQVAYEQDLLRLTQSRDGHSQSAWFDGDLKLRRYESLGGADTVGVRAWFAEYRDLDGIPLATRLTLELPVSGEQIEIALRDPEVNPALPDSLFSLTIPPDSHEVDLDRSY